MNIASNRNVFFVSIVILSILLFYAYSDIIADTYRFLGFEFNFLFGIMMICFASLVLLAISLPKSEDSIISILGIFLVMTVLIPMQILCFAGGKSFFFMLQVFICINVTIIASRIKLFHFSIRKNIRKKFLIFLSSFLIMSIFGHTFSSVGKLNFDWTLIYSQRADFHNVTNGIFKYFFVWSFKCLNIFLILYYLNNRKLLLFLLFMALQFSAALLSGHKAVALYPILAIFIYYIVKKKLNPICFLYIFIAVIFMSIIVFEYSGNSRFIALFINRIFFMTALNHYEYYEFIRDNEFVYFSNSFLSSFIPYPYSDSLPYIIGLDRWGTGTEASANTGFLANGFAHFGFTCMLLYSLILGVLVGAIDRVLKISSDEVRHIFIPLFSLTFWQLKSSDLPSLFLTHGLFVTLVLFLLYNQSTRRFELISMNK